MSRQNSREISNINVTMNGHEVGINRVANDTLPFSDVKVLLKRGEDGADGVTPSITATASVDDNVGTPSVVVTKTGTDAAPSFDFAFHNIKGGSADLTVITDEFDSTKSYAVGDYVTYDGDFYKCNTAHSGEWNASDFTLTTVGDELDLKVKKTGDTMTGELVVQDDITATGEISDGASNVLSEKFDANSFVLQKYRVTVPASAWSSTAVDGYYSCTLTLTYPINTYKEFGMELTGSADGTDPTAAESAAYSLVNYMDASDGTGVTSATLRAKTKPTTTFYIMVHGYYMQKNAATSGVALDIKTANKLNLYDGHYYVYPFDGSVTRNLYFRNVLVEIPASNWSGTVDSDGYYTNTVDTNRSFNALSGVNVSLIGSTEDTLPTAAEIAAYNLVDLFYMTNARNASDIVAKAKTKPTTSFYILVKGTYITY